MTDKQILMREIETLPPQIIGEVYNYVNFLKVQKVKFNDLTLASEKSLAKDWLLPEEDAVWSNL